jgi:hypothetical protein
VLNEPSRSLVEIMHGRRQEQLAALPLAGMLAAAGISTALEKEAQVEIELMTYPEIYAAIRADGKTTVLVVNGRIEQRGAARRAYRREWSHTAART